MVPPLDNKYYILSEQGVTNLVYHYTFMVPKKDIVENDYDLSINKYKEIEYTPVEYPPTSEIMANIRELELEIGKEMDELERLLGL